MIKYAVLSLMLLVLRVPSFAGEVISKGSYIPATLVVGTGNTPREAFEDAVASIPEGFKSNATVGQDHDCTKSELIVRDDLDEDCDMSIKGNLHRILFPITHK